MNEPDGRWLLLLLRAGRGGGRPTGKEASTSGLGATAREHHVVVVVVVGWSLGRSGTLE